MTNLAEMLASAKERGYKEGYADAIDDFLKKDKECNDSNGGCHYIYSDTDCVECIAEKLKEHQNEH